MPTRVRPTSESSRRMAGIYNFRQTRIVRHWLKLVTNMLMRLQVLHVSYPWWNYDGGFTLIDSWRTKAESLFHFHAHISQPHLIHIDTHLVQQCGARPIIWFPECRAHQTCFCQKVRWRRMLTISNYIYAYTCTVSDIVWHQLCGDRIMNTKKLMF